MLFIFEFGIPPYRRFIIDGIGQFADAVRLVSGTDRFDDQGFQSLKRLSRIIGWGENIWYWLSPRAVLDADVIFTTFNLRRPHTWLYILLFPKKRWILWGQGHWQTHNIVLKLLRKMIFRCSSGFIVYTNSGRENLINNGYAMNHICVANNTIMVRNAEATFGTDYFLYVGRLQKRKRLDLAIKSLKNTQFRLRIVGDGECKSHLLSVVHELGVADQVDFYPGTFNDVELKSHFSGALAYISPGHVGLGVVHAFAYGVPVITILNRAHAPEVEYCSAENSYLCADERQLKVVVETFSGQSGNHGAKRKAAFHFYTRNLNPEQMLSCFRSFL